MPKALVSRPSSARAIEGETDLTLAIQQRLRASPRGSVRALHKTELEASGHLDVPGLVRRPSSAHND